MINKIQSIITYTRHGSLKAEGISMLPVIRSSDTVYFKKSKFGSLKVNDIILTKKNNKFFTHRIIYRDNKYLITKGDNNQICDGRFLTKSVMGKVYHIKQGDQIIKPSDIYLLPQYQKAPDFSRGMNGILGLSVRGFASESRKKPRALARGGSPINALSPRDSEDKKVP